MRSKFLLCLYFFTLLVGQSVFSETQPLSSIIPLSNKWVILVVEDEGLSNIQAFKIISSTDPSYTQGVLPSKVTNQIVSLGQKKDPKKGSVHYAHYYYLELPHPLQSGNVYYFELESEKTYSGILKFDAKTTVSRAIKINQVGYLPNQKQKFAYLGVYLQELGFLDFSDYKTFQVVEEESQKVVFEGGIFPSKKQNIKNIGEKVYEIDLSEFHDVGRFYLVVPGVGRSWSFDQKKDVYGKVFYKTARAFYHQRYGVEISPTYTEWPRSFTHQSVIYESKYIPFFANIMPPKRYNQLDVIRYSLDLNQKSELVRGGWYGAWGFDQSLSQYSSIFDLLSIFELFPEKFSDAQLNLPESGNGIPDILDEVAYGLQIWVNSMQSDGGVSGGVERFGSSPEVYTYSLRTRWSSLLFSAAAAQYALLVRPYSSSEAHKFTNLSKLAYRFGVNPKKSLGDITILASRQNSKGTPYSLRWKEKELMLTPYLMYAKMRLYALTQDKDYLKQLPELFAMGINAQSKNFSSRNFFPWIYFSLAKYGEGVLPSSLIALSNEVLKDVADQCVEWAEQQPYRQSWDPKADSATWSKESVVSQARSLVVAYALMREEKYRTALLWNLDFILGANPMGMSWTTGLGSSYPVTIHHPMSRKKGFDDPIPGITVFGPSGRVFEKLKKEGWNIYSAGAARISEENRKVPLWRTWSAHPTDNYRQNGFTLHGTISPMVTASALFLPVDWKPSFSLKRELPKAKENLPGYYYLP